MIRLLLNSVSASYYIFQPYIHETAVISLIRYPLKKFWIELRLWVWTCFLPTGETKDCVHPSSPIAGEAFLFVI